MALLMKLVKEPTHWRLFVHGDLELGDCHEFRMAVDRILASKPCAAVLDLSNLGRLDQAGLGALVEMSHEHAAVGRRLVLVTGSAIDRLLCDTRLEGIFSTARTMEAALEMLEPPSQSMLRGELSTV